MKLERIQVLGQDGLKGWTGEVRLADVDVFAGPNGAGKSTRLLAVLAGLRGLAESPADPVREYIGPSLPAGTVDLQFDAARISRGLADTPRTAASKKADAVVEQLVGGHVARWDLGDFASATPTARQQLLDRVCDLAAGGWTVERLIGALRADLPASAVLDDLVKAHERETRPDAWLQAAVGWARSEYTSANAAQRQRKAEAEALLGEPEVEELVSPAELGEQIERLQAKERELAEQLQAARAAERAARSLEVDRQELRRLTADYAAVKDAEPPADADLAQAREQHDAAATYARDTAEALRRALTTRDRADGALQAARAIQTRPCVHCGHPDPHGETAGFVDLEAAVDDALMGVEDAELDAAAAMAEARTARERLEVLLLQQDAARRREALREQIERLEERLEATPAATRGTAELERELAEVRGQAQAVSKRRDRAVRSSERERLVQLAIASRDEAIDRFQEVSDLGKALKALKARLTEEAFRPIETEANGIVEPALGGRVVFRSGADFGLVRGDAYVPWWSLSDGERAVVGAGVSYAFARLSRAPWRAVLLDGAEAVDADRLEALLAALAARVRCGDLDNALVAVRSDAPPAVPPAVQVHWLGMES